MAARIGGAVHPVTPAKQIFIMAMTLERGRQAFDAGEDHPGDAPRRGFRSPGDEPHRAPAISSSGPNMLSTVRPKNRPRRECLAHPCLELGPGQLVSHERCLEHVDRLLAVGV
jgi:hypothetical protein